MANCQGLFSYSPKMLIRTRYEIISWFVLCASLNAQKTSSYPISYSADSFISSGHTIRVDRFQPLVSGIRPAVIMIHGSAGLFTQTGELSNWKENFGELELANHGYVTLLVHYFDSTGNVNGGDREFMQKNVKTWIRALADALEYARRLPQVNSEKIALLGESLGGFLAVALAANNKQIAAVSEYGGGIPDFALAELRSLPPTLIQHGAADILVPLEEARKLEQALEARGVPHAIIVYQAGHYFPFETRRNCLTETIKFFDKYVH